MPEEPIITSAQHPLIKHLLKLRTCKKYRDSSGEVFVEGEKVIADLARTYSFAKLITVPGQKLSPHIKYESKLVISPQNFSKISGVSTPSQIAATLKRPKEVNFGPHDQLLVLDGLQDPGNIGSLIRSAKAFGISGLFLVGDTVDYFNDKIVRASRGALFSLPFCTGSSQALLELAEKHNANLMIADIKGAPSHTLKSIDRPTYLVLGSEGTGVSSTLKQAGQSITIEMDSSIESLNVAAAGAILMHQLKREALCEV